MPRVKRKCNNYNLLKSLALTGTSIFGKMWYHSTQSDALKINCMFLNRSRKVIPMLFYATICHIAMYIFSLQKFSRCLYNTKGLNELRKFELRILDGENLMYTFCGTIQ